MRDATACDFLPWDTDHFGVRIGRVRQHRLTRASLQDILEWQESHALDCIYFLADLDDSETMRLAQNSDFQLVDIRLTLELAFGRSHPANVQRADREIIRAFQPVDIPVLEAIAKRSYTGTRFYFDRNFPRDKTEMMYGIWIRRSCEGLADEVLVAEARGQAVGYITCKVVNENDGEIGLMGVTAHARGRGVGRLLVHAALHWFAARKIQAVQVVTQGRNVPAQRLYQTCGFVTRSVQLWFHRWHSGPRRQVE